MLFGLNLKLKPTGGSSRRLLQRKQNATYKGKRRSKTKKAVQNSSKHSPAPKTPVTSFLFKAKNARISPRKKPENAKNATYKGKIPLQKKCKHTAKNAKRPKMQTKCVCIFSPPGTSSGSAPNGSAPNARRCILPGRLAPAATSPTTRHHHQFPFPTNQHLPEQSLKRFGRTARACITPHVAVRTWWQA